MDSDEENELSRSQIAVRLIYTIAYLIIFEILRVIIQITTLFQYVYLLIKVI